MWGFPRQGQEVIWGNISPPNGYVGPRYHLEGFEDVPMLVVCYAECGLQLVGLKLIEYVLGRIAQGNEPLVQLGVGYSFFLDAWVPLGSWSVSPS